MGAAPSAPIYIDVRQFEHFLPEGWLKTEWKRLYEGVCMTCKKNPFISFV
jgi:hypothetical protein